MSKTWIWILVILAVLVIGYFVWWKMKKSPMTGGATTVGRTFSSTSLSGSRVSCPAGTTFIGTSSGSNYPICQRSNGTTVFGSYI